MQALLSCFPSTFTKYVFDLSTPSMSKGRNGEKEMEKGGEIENNDVYRGQICSQTLKSLDSSELLICFLHETTGI